MIDVAIDLVGFHIIVVAHFIELVFARFHVFFIIFNSRIIFINQDFGSFFLLFLFGYFVLYIEFIDHLFLFNYFFMILISIYFVTLTDLRKLQLFFLYIPQYCLNLIIIWLSCTKISDFGFLGYVQLNI